MREEKQNKGIFILNEIRAKAGHKNERTEHLCSLF
jgi:hypothetical protein